MSTKENFGAAMSLYHEAQKEGLSYGCFEVCLVALGAQLTIENVRRENREKTPFIEAIEKHGFKINWAIEFCEELSEKDIDSLFKEDTGIEGQFPDGDLAGYLWMEQYPGRKGHMNVLFPGENGEYLLLDTTANRPLVLKSSNLAKMTKYITVRGGSFDILEIRKPKQVKLYLPE